MLNRQPHFAQNSNGKSESVKRCPRRPKISAIFKDQIKHGWTLSWGIVGFRYSMKGNLLGVRRFVRTLSSDTAVWVLQVGCGGLETVESSVAV